MSHHIVVADVYSHDNITWGMLAAQMRTVLVQDSRQWGPSFCIRAGALGARTWHTGETLAVAFTLSSDRPLAVQAEETAAGMEELSGTVRANAESCKRARA